MSENLKTADDSSAPGKLNAPGATGIDQTGLPDHGADVDNTTAHTPEGTAGEKRMIFKGTFPEDVFSDDEEGRLIFAEQNYCPSLRMTLIAVIVLALLYLAFC